MMNIPEQQPKEKTGYTPRPVVDLLLSIVIPSAILMKFSSDEALGVTSALMLALAFPVCWGVFELLKHH